MVGLAEVFMDLERVINSLISWEYQPHGNINAHDADGVISKPAVPAKVIRRGRFGSEYARIRCDAITIKADSR